MVVVGCWSGQDVDIYRGSKEKRTVQLCFPGEDARDSDVGCDAEGGDEGQYYEDDEAIPE